MSVLTVYTALLFVLVACTDSGTASSDSGPSLDAAKPVSTQTSTGVENSDDQFSDESITNSATTNGFVGEVLDGSIRISWNEDSDATGYNVYRQGKYYATVFNTEFHDTDIVVQDYSYQITAFDKSGENTRYYTIARGLIVSVLPEPVNNQYFKSPTTFGFVGEVLDESIRISWKEDLDATGYNVYRQGKYYATVFNTEFHDTDIEVRDYSYRITAFEKTGDSTRYYTIAKDLVVSVVPESVNQYFKSPATFGFAGEVLDESIRVSWKEDPDATGYNVYRQGKYYATVFNTEFQDTDIRVQDYSYQITAFEKTGENTRYYTIAKGLVVTVRTLGNTAIDTSNGNDGVVESGEADTVPNDTAQPATGTSASAVTDSESTDSESVTAHDNEAESTSSTGSTTPDIDAAPIGEPGEAMPKTDNSQYFESVTTEGFSGEVLDDSIRINWNKDSEARGYNVYRQAEYYTTVFTNEFFDTDVYDQDYYYEIQAFDHGKTGQEVRYYYIATGLTVSANTMGKTDPNRAKPNDDLLKDYELVFFDEFSDDRLDASKWNTSFLWGTDLIINNEEQYYVDILKDPEFGFNPFTFDGNNLTINTIKTPSVLTKKSLDQPYLSGIITSYDAFKFTYGYAEVRAKMTHGRGYWPAFWLLNAYYGGEDPEIDIMEFVGDNQDVVYHTFHYYDESGKLRSTKSEPTPGIDYTADFHTFSVKWIPGSIIYFVDGIEAHRITDPKVPQEQMYLIANTAVGGWWAGSPDESTTFPGKFVVDYIRVYQKVGIYNDGLYNDGMRDGLTDVPYADDIPNQAFPNHRPTREQWPEGYPYD